MSNFKKFFAITVGIMTVFGVVGFVPQGAKAAAAGDLIKMAGNPAVYYFDGTKRYVFPQENVYKSWYKDFSGVQTISQSELQSYPIGGNVTMRPGTWMVKIQTDPKVYAVEPGGKLRHVDSEARALALWGANWNKMIVDVSDAFFVNYTMGTPLNSDTHPTGTVIKRGTQYYYVDNGTERPFASEAALAANKINTAFAVETTKDYPDGSSITGAEPALTNVAGSASSSSASAAGLTVSGGAMTASTSLPKDANNVKVGTWNFTAGPEGAVTLSSVTFKRTGVGNVSDISAAYLYDGANRLTSARTFNSSTNEANFTALNLNIPAGSTKALSLYVSIATNANAASTHSFMIEAASKVSTNATSVNGVFPISSNSHSIAGASAGNLTIEKSGSLTAASVGDKAFKVSEFKLTASNTEDAYVNQVTLTQGGNINNSALSNFVLKQAGSTVATASAIASNDRLDFVFSPAFKIEKGNNRVFELYADITGKPNDTYGFYVEDKADVIATGGTFGVGMAITLNANFDQFSDPGISQTLQGGAFTISFNGPTSANISNSAEDVVIWKATIYSANEVEVRNWRFGLQDLTSANPDLCDSSTNCAVQDIKLWNLDNNTVIAGPYEFTPAPNLGDPSVAYFTLTEDYVFPAGSTTNIGLSVDIKGTPNSNTLSLKARMGNGTNSFTANDIKHTSSNTYLSLGTDITPSSEIVGTTQTVVAGGLTVATAPSPTDNNMIKGASNHTAVAFNFSAGPGSSVKVNSIQVTAGTSDTNDNSYAASGDGVSVSNLILQAKLMDGTTQVGTPKSFVSGVATFNNLNWTLNASQTKKLDVVITTNSAATLVNSNDDYLRLSLAASSVSAVDGNGNTITVSGLPANEANLASDIVVTVKASGSLTASLAPTPTNPTSRLIASGSTDQVLAAFKFDAIDEAFLVKKLTLISSSATQNGRIAQLRVRYPKQAGGTETRVVGLSGVNNLVDISDTPMFVAHNGSANLEVLGDASLFTNLDGSEGGTIYFTLDNDNSVGNNQATGVASNTDQNTWGSDSVANQHQFVRTILTVAAGSGTPNNQPRTRSASQKVASWNLSASSSSSAFLRGSRKAPDGVATGWTATGGGTAATIGTAGNFVSGSSAITSGVGTANTAGTLSFDFGATPGLQVYPRLSAWVKITLSGGSTTATLSIDDTANLASPQGSSSAITADGTWQFVDMTTTGIDSNTRYVGVTYTAAGVGNTVTVVIDDMRFYHDSIVVDVTGDLNTTAPKGLLFSLKDSGSITRMYGAYTGTTTAGTVKLIAGNGADVTVDTVYSSVEISSSTLALDLETNTNSLMKADTTANESLNVSVDTGAVGSAGDFVWYDNSDNLGGNDVAGLTVVNPISTTITFANTY